MMSMFGNVESKMNEDVKNIDMNKNKVDINQDANLDVNLQKNKYFDLLQDFCNQFNPQNVDNIPRFCENNNASWSFEQGPTIDTEAMVNLTKTFCHPSFPDMSCKLIPSSYFENGNTVTVDVLVSGKFSGKPFGPFGVPLISPNNKIVTNGIETSVIKLVNGKIKSIYICSPSDGIPIGGPLGIYLRAGGDLKNVDMNQVMSNMKSMGTSDVKNLNVSSLSISSNNNDTMVKQNMDTLQRCFQLYTNGDIDGVCANISDDCVWTWGDQNSAQLGLKALPWYGTYQGPAQIKAAMEQVRSFVNVTAFTLEEIEPLSGNRFLTFIHKGYTNRNNPSFKSDYKSLGIYQFNDQGKLCKFEDFADTLIMHQQLQLSNANHLQSAPQSLSHPSKAAAYIAVVEGAYEDFTKGNIAHLLNTYTPLSGIFNWTWGTEEAAQIGYKSLPWYGQYTNRVDAVEVFRAYDLAFQTLSFVPTKMIPQNNQVIAFVNLRVKSKKTEKVGEVTLVHVFQFDQDDKIEKFNEFSDSAYASSLLS